MQEIGLRSATSNDAAFALYVTEACMRVYAEQTWGSWNGRANFDPALDNIIVLAGEDIGLIGIRRCSDHWFLGKRLTGDYVWSTTDQSPTGTLRLLQQR